VKKIVLIGAAAKANTFINYYKLDSTMIDFITDSSESKIGKKTPLSRIPIVDDSALEDFGKVYAIITSWNISESLRQKLLSINPEIEYITL
jgi:NADH/NAD ratio-sensing transcriptional regulator Rex